MKLRLTQPGWLTYTGQMGVTMFKDGLSEGDVLVQDGMRVAAAIGAEWEDGSPANIGQMYLNNMDSPAHVGGSGPVPDDINHLSMPVEKAETAPKAKTKVVAKPAASEFEPAEVFADEIFSEEGLADIADEKGIAGLRAIADPLNVKATSITALIDGILKAQANKA